MPEGPEVKIMADGLRSVLDGSYIQKIVVTPASRYYKDGLDNLSNVNFPIMISKVSSKGKKIVINCYDTLGNTVTLISALGMEGSWRMYSGKHAGIELHFVSPERESKIVYFHDTRHFGTFHICTDSGQVCFVLKSVGPDLLSENVSFEDYYSVITQEKLGHKEICWFLMEQKFFSGIGNYILAEVLYEAKVLPTRLLKNLSYDEVYAIWYHAKRILRESYKSGGLTIATYFSMAGERGIYETKVYGKSKDPLGNPVLTGTFSNGRTSHYVPAVQI